MKPDDKYKRYISYEKIGCGDVNSRVLKDTKIILSFTLSFVFEIIGIVLASKNNDYWVVFVVLGIFLTFYGVNRANRRYRGK